MKNLLSIFKQTGIDFSRISVYNRSERSGINYFDLKPKDFIRYAKEDLKFNDKKGLVNSLTNSKRAIDCQIDTILSNYGITFDKIPKASEELIKISNLDHSNLPHKLKLIQALKFSPSELTSRTRNLRNRLEHYYQIPSEKEIKESLEIAELFILSCESKTKWFEDEFIITNENYRYLHPHPFVPIDKMHLEALQITMYKNFISINFDQELKEFKITPTISKTKKKAIKFSQSNPEFYFLIRLLNSRDDQNDFLEALIYLLKVINHPIPEKNIIIDNWE